MRNLEIVIILFVILAALVTLLAAAAVDHEISIFNDLIGFAQEGVNPTIDYNNATLKDPSLKVEKVVDGLDFSTTMAFLGPDDMIVLEQRKGTVQRIVNGTKQSAPILDL